MGVGQECLVASAGGIPVSATCRTASHSLDGVQGGCNPHNAQPTLQRFFAAHSCFSSHRISDSLSRTCCQWPSLTVEYTCGLHVRRSCDALDFHHRSSAMMSSCFVSVTILLELQKK